MARDYTKRKKSEYNVWRRVFQWLTIKVAYSIWFRLVHGLKIYGRENVPKDKFVIVASNHLSAIDPFLVIYAVGHRAAYIAKKELFEKPVSRFFMDLLGAFAVNRDKLGVSTIKTALTIKETGWFLALFPQGKRMENNDISSFAMGFVKIAKILKCGVLPVGIIGTQKEERKNIKNKMEIRIGKPIEYMEDVDKMAQLWVNSIKELTNSAD